HTGECGGRKEGEEQRRGAAAEREIHVSSERLRRWAGAAMIGDKRGAVNSQSCPTAGRARTTAALPGRGPGSPLAPRPPHRSCESLYRAVGLKRRLAIARCPLPSAGAPARRSRLGLRTARVNRCTELSASSVDSRS